MDYNSLASTNMYNYNNPRYYIYPGKIYQQSLHYWIHRETNSKWKYSKDSNNTWGDFYRALHNPPSEEKLVNLYRCFNTAGSAQIWAYKEI